ncbi:nucleotidyltransferase family protein [Prauserella flavalba]|uniref:Polymerase nucleotidyl transferase domain-containing protein n=1 Tax=Prauserella flavalba TaxID=1477506 RepID=A0A318LZ77_9PSEU|nr:nucleotidyltransferase domain-containing protein [Prauserella flavalba]PXY38068.1 hypothetical protein BA062_05625 [Prauserella flavalba]
MHELVEMKRHDIEELCRALSVRRLDVFGSAVGESFNAETSDVDVLVEFAGGPGFDYFDAYFSLREGLERILGRPVDVVSATSIRNPYFKQQVLDSRELLYAA